MKITEEVLVDNGFEKKWGNDGPYYVKGEVGIVKNLKWLPCNVETGEPKNTCSYVNTMEELAYLAKQAGLSI